MQIFSKDALKKLAYWIVERESIRQKKVKDLPKPWTKDPLLRDHRWCNVRRMDDKVSQWLMLNYYPATIQAHQALVAAVLARMINWPDSLRAVYGRKYSGFSYDVALKRLQARKAREEKVFTGAYIINGAAGGDKIVQVLRTVNLISKFKFKIVDTASMEATWAMLLKYKFQGIGSFIAGQVVADLRHVLKGAWVDRYSWAPIGPGSRRGMRRMLGIAAHGPMLQSQFDELLPALWERLMYHSAASKVFEDHWCESMDLQNCLCEFDKYMRLINKEGSVRSGYPGMPETGDLFQ